MLSTLKAISFASATKELEKLQKQHEEELKALNAKANSKAGSRRGSISGGFSQRRASIAMGLKPGLLAGKNFVNSKITVENYLNELYDNVGLADVGHHPVHDQAAQRQPRDHRPPIGRERLLSKAHRAAQEREQGREEGL